MCSFIQYVDVFFLIIRRPPRSTRTDTLFPYPTLFRSLEQGVLEELKGWSPTECGTPQGAVVSPLLANLYLDALDWKLRLGGWELVRYADRSEEHTSELQSLMRISYAVFCLKKKNKHTNHCYHYHIPTYNYINKDS